MTAAAARIPAIILMGVSGSGKSAVGRVLAATFGVPFIDGDNLHPASNIAKMSQQIPLTDEDRWPWLDTVGAVLRDHADEGVIVACSALRRSYRDVLSAHEPSTVFVMLSGSRELLHRRLVGRRHHFMPPELLDSQLATLQPLAPDERGFVVDVTPPVAAVAQAIADGLRSYRESGT